MLIYRYIFLFIFTIFYSIKFNSLAVEPKINNFILNQNKNTIVVAQTQTVLAQKYTVLVNSNKIINPEKKEKAFYLAGILLTSITFLFIVFLLFKPEKQKNTKETKIPLVKTEVIVFTKNEAESLARENNIVIIPDTNANPVKSEDRSDIAEEKTSEPIFSMIGMEEDEELAYQPILEEIVEVREAELINSETTVAEIPPESTGSSEPQVNCDLMGKLTIVNSQTTKIDVVFELIQDLQKNSSVNSKRAKNLRRKAIWELGQTKDFRAIEHLIEILPKVGSLEKSLILDSISKIANHSFKTVNSVLLTSLEDESVEVRKNAIKDLIYLYQSLSSVTIQLSKMTEDSNLEVQNTAKWALEQFEKISFPIAFIDDK